MWGAAEYDEIPLLFCGLSLGLGLHTLNLRHFGVPLASERRLPSPNDCQFFLLQVQTYIRWRAKVRKPRGPQ